VSMSETPCSRSTYSGFRAPLSPCQFPWQSSATSRSRARNNEHDEHHCRVSQLLSLFIHLTAASIGLMQEMAPDAQVCGVPNAERGVSVKPICSQVNCSQTTNCRSFCAQMSTLTCMLWPSAEREACRSC
jgi:hypothetical protein